jgi:sRNA-binding regulator protein Hfq
MNITKISTEKDLDMILGFLQDQGFGYIHKSKLIDSKVENIISNANKLKIKNVDSDLEYKIKYLRNFDEMKKIAEEYFSKYDTNYKLKELLNKFYIQPNESVKTPWNDSTLIKDIINWVKFKTKHNITDESKFGSYETVEYYNLDKPSIKIRFNDNDTSEFNNLYKLIYNEDCDENYKEITGSWYNLGKIEIKFYLNNTIEMKGDLEKFKEYYYKLITEKIYTHLIIKYKDKTEIIYHKKND